MTILRVTRNLFTRGNSILLRVLSDAIDVGDFALVSRIRTRLLSDGLSLSDLATAAYVPTGGAAGFTPQSGFSASGTATHGGLLTITRDSGSFGTHADYNPSNYTWNSRNFLNGVMVDFEDGDLEKHGMGYNISGDILDTLATKWAISTSAPTNLTKSARRFFAGAEQGPLEWYMPQVTGQLYVTFKYRVTKPRRSGKFFRVWGHTSRNIYFSTGEGRPGINGYEPYEYVIRAYAEEMNAGGTEYDGQNPQFGDGTWHRVEIYLDQVSGLATVWLDGEERWTNNWLIDFMALDHSVDIGEMIDNEGREPDDPTGLSEEYFADIFYDLTRNRFEAADSATWANRTRSEIQIPTAWGTTSVTFSPNRGEHDALPGQHLFHLNTSNTPTYLGVFT